jgi:tRNA (mo5U34)-methyltransferase
MEVNMDTESLRNEVAKIRWWHRIDLGSGVVTPGEIDSSKLLKRMKLPEDLRGRSVLDIGAWDGFYSFEAERRGADRVLATDSFCWGGPGWGTKAGFELARQALNSKVEDKEIDVLEITPQRIGTFDLVLFLGVLYHMRHPLLALEKVFSVTGDQLILSTHTSMLHMKQPVMRFYPKGELGGDQTNWWGPNAIAVKDMLKDVGFRRVEIISRHNFVYGLAKAVRCKIKHEERPFSEVIHEDHMVFHAFK